MDQSRSYKQELLEKTKRYIKGIIESSPRQFSWNDIEREYKIVVDEKLPYRELGFLNPLELYKSMPDILRINGGLVQNVPSESSAHVEKMVKEQKRPIRPIRKTSHLQFSSNRYQSPQFQPRNTFYNIQPHAFVPYVVAPRLSPLMSLPPQMHFQSSWNMPVNPLNVPQADKFVIQDILSSVPNGLNFSDLQTMYFHKVGKNLNPYFYGYSNVLDFLRAIGDVVKVRNLGRELLILPVIESKPADHILVNSMQSLSVSNGAGDQVKNDADLIDFEESEKIWSLEELKALAEKANRPTLPNMISEDQVAINEKEEDFLNSDSKMNTDNQDLYGISTDYEENAKLAANPISIVSENLDDAKNEIYLSDANDLSLHEEELLEILPQDSFKMLLQVICSACNGVDVNNVPEMFEDFHDQALCLPNNISSLEPILLNMPSYFEITDKNGLKFVKGTTKASNWLKSIIFNTIKEDLAVPCTEIPEPQLPNAIIINSTNEVLISCILHPDKFWVQLVEFLPELDNLTMKMNAAYEDLTISRSYAIPKDSISFYLNCAAYCEKDNSWKRVMIINFDGIAETAEVRYVDFGNGAKVPSSNLRYLKKEFAEHPVMCFQSKMANILNKDKVKWSMSVQKKLESLCLHKRFSVQFMKIECPLILKFNNEFNLIENLENKMLDNKPQIKIRPKESIIRGNSFVNDVQEKSKKCEVIIERFNRPKESIIRGNSFVNDVQEKPKKCEEKENRLNTSSPILNKESMSCVSTSTEKFEMKSVKSRKFVLEETTKVGNSDETLNTDCRDKTEIREHFHNQCPSKDVNSLIKPTNKQFVVTSVIQNLDDNYQILPTQLLSKVIHIIQINGANYLQDFEVSSFLWKANILNQMANAVDFDLKVILIKSSSHPKLFDDLLILRSDICKVPTSEICLVPLQIVVTAIPKIVFRRESDTRPLLSFLSMFKN